LTAICIRRWARESSGADEDHGEDDRQSAAWECASALEGDRVDLRGRWIFERSAAFIYRVEPLE
jgi:hypothetical protein